MNAAVKKNRKSPATESCPWVETGESVSRLYSEARGEARDLALARNAYFTQVSWHTCIHCSYPKPRPLKEQFKTDVGVLPLQAYAAFRAGDKKAASNLARKGREMNNQMWSAHKEASTRILDIRGQSQREGSFVRPCLCVRVRVHMFYLLLITSVSVSSLQIAQSHFWTFTDCTSEKQLVSWKNLYQNGDGEIYRLL